MLKIRQVSDYELKVIRTSKGGKLEGLFELDDPVYRKAPGLSASALKEFSYSPAAYKNSLTAPRKQTPAMKFGTAAHCAVLEPDCLAKRYIVEPHFDGPKNKNPWKAEWEEFKKGIKGKILLTMAEMATLKAMTDSIKRIEWVDRYFREGTPEVAMFWIDPATGIQCKAKMDWLSEEWGIVDYKTTSANLGGSEESCAYTITNEVMKWKYWLQKAHYLNGMAALDLDCARAFTFIFQKTYGGFDTVPYWIHPEDVERAWAVRTELMKEFGQCQERGEWPPLTHKLVMGHLPDYAFR